MLMIATSTVGETRQLSGAVTGWIIDQTGGRLAGVVVTLRDDAHGRLREAVTDADGT
jgi:hypothetical protein